MTSSYLERPLRTIEQATGRNVIKFPLPRDPWPYEKGAEPPKFLTKKDAGSEQ